MIVLGIESSCDETSVAVVRDGTDILSSVVASQIARHRPHGGVVPEIAAREHERLLVPILHQALEEAGLAASQIDRIAVTERPGLLQALLCGIASAEALGVATGVEVIGVNHVEAHLVAPFLAHGERPRFPLVSLVVSGGHTHLFRSEAADRHELLGATLDDAAGECFDKIARMLGLGFPGGPALQKAAASGNPRAFPLKRPLLAKDSLDFSFSGLKTAALYRFCGQDERGRPKPTLDPAIDVADAAASVQACIVEVLVEKLSRAVRQTGIRLAAVGGGVACNGPLREALASRAEAEGFELLLAPPALCTDNAAMVAAQGAELLALGSGASPRPAARATWTRRPAAG